MREFREVRINVAGDRARGHTLIPLARKFLGALKNRMALGGLSQLVGRHLLEDGSAIEVRSAFGLDAITIFTPLRGASTSEAIASILGRVTLRLTVEDPEAFVIFALTDARSRPLDKDNRYIAPTQDWYREDFVDTSGGIPGFPNPEYIPSGYGPYIGPSSLLENGFSIEPGGANGPFLIDLCTFDDTLVYMNRSVSQLATFFRATEPAATETVELPFLEDGVPPYQITTYHGVRVADDPVVLIGAGWESFSAHHQTARALVEILDPELKLKPALNPPYRLYAKYVTNVRKLDYAYQLQKRGEPYVYEIEQGGGTLVFARVDTHYDKTFDGQGEMTLSGADLRSLQLDAHARFVDLYRSLWSSESWQVQVQGDQFELVSFATHPKLYRRPSRGGSVPTRVKIEVDIMGHPERFHPGSTFDLALSQYGFSASSFEDMPKKGDGWIHVLTIDPEKNGVAFVGKPYD